MSDITQNFEINSIDLGVTVDTNQLTFTPDGISLNIYAGGVGTSNSLTANIANVHIYGGVNGYVLQTDGTGNLDWTAMTGGGGGNGTPGGANTQVQYNDSGSFGGSAGFTFNEVTGFLNVPGNVTAPYFVGNATFATFAAAATTAATVTTNAQPNITSVGNLVSLTVIGNSNTGNIYTSGLSGNISGANVITANTFVANSTVNFTAASNVSLGSISNVKITGGSANYVLQTDGTGNLSWIAATNSPASNISNGTSNVNIPTINGNVITAVNGTNRLTVTSTGIVVAGNISANNITANILATNVVGTVPNAVAALRANSVWVAGLGASALPSFFGTDANTLALRSTNGNLQANAIIALGNLYVGSGGSGSGNLYLNTNCNLYANTGALIANRAFVNVVTTNQLVYANLPSLTAGSRALISDANTRTFDSVVGGGGANYMPVWNDGTNWRVG